MNLCEGDFDKSCYMYCLDAALIHVISQSIRVISTLIRDIIGYYTCNICADTCDIIVNYTSDIYIVRYLCYPCYCMYV